MVTERTGWLARQGALAAKRSLWASGLIHLSHVSFVWGKEEQTLRVPPHVTGCLAV